MANFADPLHRTGRTLDAESRDGAEQTDPVSAVGPSAVDGPLHQRLLDGVDGVPVVGQARQLIVGRADDPLETAADAAADYVIHRLSVMDRAAAVADPWPTAPRRPARLDDLRRKSASVSAGDLLTSPAVHRHTASCGHLRRTGPANSAQTVIGENGGQLDTELSARIDGARALGRPLSGSALQRMNVGFGRSFSSVRIHDDEQAAEFSRSLMARAFTSGRDIFFDGGQYQPDTAAGELVLAHELAHVVQESSSVGRLIASVIRRFPVTYRNPSPPPLTIDMDTEHMSVPELDQVIKDGSPPYAMQEYQAAIDERVGRALDVIDAEWIALAEGLNNDAILPSDFARDVMALFAIKQGVLDRVFRILQNKVTRQDLIEKIKPTTDPLNRAALWAVNSVKTAGGLWEKSKVTKIPEVAKLPDVIKDKSIPYPGMPGSVPEYIVETVDSKKHVTDAGIVALNKCGALTADQLHWVVNALLVTDREAPGTDLWIRWSKLLDDFAPLWVQVKPASAKDWITRALLPKGVRLKAHYLGMFGELVEAKFIIAGGQLKPGTLLTMGKEKARTPHPALKVGTKATQDVDMSFHHQSGVRHYVEVKADPGTLVKKIGEDQTKKMIDDTDLRVTSDPDLATTPDQILSYEETKTQHEAKPTKAGRYPTGKRIIVIYATPKIKDWLSIFTSKAGVRLIKHHSELRLAGYQMGAVELQKIQDFVTTKTTALSMLEKKAWTAKYSVILPQDFSLGRDSVGITAPDFFKGLN